MTPATAESIRSQLLSETEELEALLGWDLTNWKPESAGGDAKTAADEQAEGEELA